MTGLCAGPAEANRFVGKVNRNAVCVGAKHDAPAAKLMARRASRRVILACFIGCDSMRRKTRARSILRLQLFFRLGDAVLQPAVLNEVLRFVLQVVERLKARIQRCGVFRIPGQNDIAEVQ